MGVMFQASGSLGDCLGPASPLLTVLCGPLWACGGSEGMCSMCRRKHIEPDGRWAACRNMGWCWALCGGHGFLPICVQDPSPSFNRTTQPQSQSSPTSGHGKWSFP